MKMEMTEEFSRVHEMFEKAKNHALIDGKTPIKALFGPEEFAAFLNYIKIQDYVSKGVQGMPQWLGVTQFEVTFHGLPIRRMAHPGVAIVTSLQLGIIKWANGFNPQN